LIEGDESWLAIQLSRKMSICTGTMSVKSTSSSFFCFIFFEEFLVGFLMTAGALTLVYWI